jgi:hypothetical protein
MDEILLEPQFLPPIEYFTRLNIAKKIYFDVHQYYEKQTYRNRCYIRGANKIERLTVPVIAGNRTPFHQVKINYDPDWVKKLWRSLASSYANAPFFLFYADDFKKIFFSRPDYLLDLDHQLLTLCLKLLNLNVEIIYTDKYVENLAGNIHDLRSAITPKQTYSSRPFYKPVEYQQLFGANFDTNLSVIDLLFCEGPNARTIINRSVKSE